MYVVTTKTENSSIIPVITSSSGTRANYKDFKNVILSIKEISMAGSTTNLVAANRIVPKVEPLLDISDECKCFLVTNETQCKFLS